MIKHAGIEARLIAVAEDVSAHRDQLEIMLSERDRLIAELLTDSSPNITDIARMANVDRKHVQRIRDRM